MNVNASESAKMPAKTANWTGLSNFEFRFLMTAVKKYLIVFCVGLMMPGLPALSQSLFSSSSQQANPDCKPPRNRELFHGFIDEQQKILLKSDGKNDNKYTPSKDEEINFLLTQSLINRVDALQCKIENDSTL